MSISRRHFMLAAAGMGLGASLGLSPARAADLNKQLKALKGRQLVVTTWGGSTADAFRAAYFNDFSKNFGVEIIQPYILNYILLDFTSFLLTPCKICVSW